MKRIIIIVEGITEERFVRKVLHPHFINLGIHLEPEQWITNRKTGDSGGGSNFDLVENHIRRRISRYSKDSDTFLTTMIDLYAFPLGGRTVYDDEVKAATRGVNRKYLLEKKMSERFNFYRFIPYVQLYEFESLLYSDILKLATFYPDKNNEILELSSHVAGLNPEDINDRRETSPSHRIIKFIPF